jgi:hypothetical protein
MVALVLSREVVTRGPYVASVEMVPGKSLVCEISRSGEKFVRTSFTPEGVPLSEYVEGVETTLEDLGFQLFIDAHIRSQIVGKSGGGVPLVFPWEGREELW